MSEIKTALERFKAYCKSKGIPEKSSLAHIHKIGQFEEHERKELRAAYESLKAENVSMAKRIDELEAATEHLGLTPQQAADGLARHKAQVAEIESLRKQVEIANEYLQRLSRLGNGGLTGNSLGNVIAIEALNKIAASKNGE